MLNRDRMLSLSLFLVALTVVPNVFASTYVLYLAVCSPTFWKHFGQPLAVIVVDFALLLGGSAVLIASIFGNRFAARFAVCYLIGLLALVTIDAVSKPTPEWARVPLFPYFLFFREQTVTTALTAWVSFLLIAIFSAIWKKRESN
jgi:hypothetical protein